MDTSAPSCILVAADPETASVAAVDRAASLAAALDAELVLLVVIPSAVVDPRYSAALAMVPDELVRDGEDVERTLAQRRARFSDVVPPAVRSRWVHGYSPAGPAVVQAADAVAADLVVVPMHRGSEMSHLLRDGTDRHVLHHSPVPVLVVPAG